MFKPDTPHTEFAAAHQVARDLVWCLEAPGLLQEYPPYLAKLTPACKAIAKTRLLSADAVDIPACRRLGYYYEALWAQLFTVGLQQKLVAANQQIIVDGCTLGALDLLTYCSSERTYTHTELAVKFYLCDADGSQLHHWIGPNGTDRLDLKLSRLTQHQLPLGVDLRAQRTIGEWLARLKLPSLEHTHWRQQFILQGWLFTRWRADTTKTHHRVINSQHLQGYWLKKKEMRIAVKEADWREQHWVILPKLYWLSSAQLTETQLVRYPLDADAKNLYLSAPVLLSSMQLEQLLALQQDATIPQPLLIAQVHRVEGQWITVHSGERQWREAQWLEHQRLMLVENDWPMARASR